MFDSYNNPGLLLGTIQLSIDEAILNNPAYDKATGRWSQYYEGKKFRVFPDKVSQFFRAKDANENFVDIPEDVINKFAFVVEYSELLTPEDHGLPNDNKTYALPKGGQGFKVPDNGIKINNEIYYFTDEALNKGIPFMSNYVSIVEYTWVSIYFTEEIRSAQRDLFNADYQTQRLSPFKNGWVKDGKNIDTDGADKQLISYYGFRQSEGFRNDYWLRTDTIAATRESALQLLIEEARDGNTADITDPALLDEVFKIVN